MQISAAHKTRRFSRLASRIQNDRGNIGLTVMMGTVLMMLATYAAVKALGPALHTISARSDIRRAGTLSNLANSYIAQTGDMQPTIAKLVSAGLLPSGAKGVCATCGGVGTYATNDGSVLSMVPGGSAGIFGMTLVPGPNMARDMNYYLSHLTGSIQNGSTVVWNQPVPAIANLGSRFVQTNPVNPGATQIVTSPLSTGANPINSGSVNTGTVNSSSINSGSINTGTVNSSSINSGVDNTGGVYSSGPVLASGDTTLWHGVIWYYYAPQVPCTYGGWCGNLAYGYWPAQNLWWYNTPGYSGCAGNNPSMGVNMPYGSVQVWQGGSCGSWARYVPGGPYGY